MSAETLLAFDFPAVARKIVTAAFDGGGMASDGGVLLPAAAGQRLPNLKKSPRRVFDLSGAGIFAIVSRFFATDPGSQIVKLSLLAGTSLLAVLTAASPALAVPVFTSSSPGAHTFTVATTGLYDILAEGAQGGPSIIRALGGEGAKVEAKVSLTAGEVLSILVGGEGGAPNTEGQGGGGGGGTFVVAVAGSTPLLIAGGGGGGGYGAPGTGGAAGGPGQTGTAGQNGYGSPAGSGGTKGLGGGAGPEAGGGGGFSGSGTGVANYAGGGSSFAAGGAGGAGAPVGAYAAGAGGIGGGGGGAGESGGGGGGYSGGGGGGAYTGVLGTASGGGGGGGSFLAAGATPISLVAGYRPGNGYVSISSLTASPTPEPGSAALLGAGVVLLAAAASRRRVRED